MTAKHIVYPLFVTMDSCSDQAYNMQSAFQVYLVHVVNCIHSIWSTWRCHQLVLYLTGSVLRLFKNNFPINQDPAFKKPLFNNEYQPVSYAMGPLLY